MASLVRRSRVATTRMCGGLAGIRELLGDAPEQHLSQDLALVGLDPELLEPVLGREDRIRGDVGVGHATNANPDLSVRRCRRARATCPSVVSSAPMVTVLMPLPASDFDPTEVAVSWQVLSAAGHDVVFATPSGQPGRADDLMVTGRGLDPWGAVPGLRRLTVVGRVLRADADARRAYAALLEDAAFGAPLHWGAARRSAYDALRAAGRPPGPGMRPISRAPRCSRWPSTPSAAGKPVGAICHGVLVAARAVDPRHGALGAARPADHGADLGAGAQGLGHRPLDPLLGPQLLPDLRRGAGPALGLHVGAAGGDAGVGRPRRLRRRGEGHARLAAQDERACPRHAGRRPAGLGRARRLVRVGPLARRRAHLRPDVRRGAGRTQPR